MASTPNSVMEFLSSIEEDKQGELIQMFKELIDRDSDVSKQRKKRTKTVVRKVTVKSSEPRPPIASAAKRPLNSWMAFRAYYSPLFTSLQQKDISGALTEMWAADPFHAKWTIVAKAYSVIRDQVGKVSTLLTNLDEVLTQRLGSCSSRPVPGYRLPTHRYHSPSLLPRGAWLGYRQAGHACRALDGPKLQQQPDQHQCLRRRSRSALP